MESSISKTYGDAAFAVLVSGGQSTGKVTYAVTEGADVLSIDASSGQVALLKSGTAVVTATRLTDDYYLSASSQISIQVAKADQAVLSVTVPSVTEPSETEPSVNEPSMTEPTADAGDNTVLLVILTLFSITAVVSLTVFIKFRSIKSKRFKK